MVEPKTAGNVGFIARTMKNFSMQNLIILNPRYAETDAGEITGYAMHGKDILERASILTIDGCNDGKEKIMDAFLTIIGKYQFIAGTTAKHKGRKKLHRVPITPVEAGKRLARERSLLVLGREDTGLTDAETRACDTVITIDSNPAYPTLNISHAAAIIFYETWNATRTALRKGETRDKTQKSKKIQNSLNPASRDSKHAFYSWLEGILSGEFKDVTDGWRRNNFFHAVKNVIERANITERELNVINGFLRTVQSKTR
ncbi:MAG: RNA methyltransferase [Promethearchaeota archaeon]